ncbi:24830_t:CDS:2, partial [Racocetra persica]
MSIASLLSRKECLTTKARTGSLITVFNYFARFSNETEDYDRVFEWIPYDQLTKFKIIGKGGFGVVQQSTWLEGQIDQIIGWNSLRKQWERHGKTRVA